MNARRTPPGRTLRLPAPACALLAAGLAAAAAAAAADGPGFGPEGLRSLVVAGAERLQSGAPALWRAATASGAKLDLKARETRFDAEARVLVVTYGWGAVTYAYEPLADGVRLAVTVTNGGPETVTELGFNLLVLAGLGEPQRLGRATSCVEGPPVVAASGPDGAIAWAAGRPDGRPLGLELSAASAARTPQAVHARVHLGGGRLVLDNVPAERPIPPGGGDAFAVVLRAAGPGTDPLDLARAELEAHRAAFPPRLAWADRRPILRLFFGGGLPKEQALANLRDPDAVRPPEPDAKFQTHVLGRMRSTVGAARAVDAQGVIVWDLEGETFPHAVTYIGDPRLIRVLNPQMDLAIDEGMRILRDGGLRVGLTVRPSRVIYDEKKGTASHSHTVAADPFLELDGKIAYARKRWGCTLFYIDTNYFWRPYGEEKKWTSGPIAPDVWRRLLAKHPEVLLIPEIPQPGYYDSTAPYGEADMGDWGTPALVRRVWPDAWRVIVIEDADAVANHDRFVACVRERNALMTYGFSAAAPNMVALARIRAEAELLDAGAPAPVQAAAEPGALAALLASPERAVRYHAARALRDRPGAAGPALLARAADPAEDWVVRRAALLALAAAPEPPALAPLADLVVEPKLGLHDAAAQALAARGEAAVAEVLARLAAEASSPDGKPLAAQRLGGVLVRVGAQAQHARLQELFAAVPESKQAVAMRRALVDTVGRLKDPAAAAFLAGVFRAGGDLEGAAADALVRLAAPEGIALVREAAARAKEAGEAARAERLNAALRAK